MYENARDWKAAERWLLRLPPQNDPAFYRNEVPAVSGPIGLHNDDLHIEEYEGDKVSQIWRSGSAHTGGPTAIVCRDINAQTRTQVAETNIVSDTADNRNLCTGKNPATGRQVCVWRTVGNNTFTSYRDEGGSWSTPAALTSVGSILGSIRVPFGNVWQTSRGFFLCVYENGIGVEIYRSSGTFDDWVFDNFLSTTSDAEPWITHLGSDRLIMTTRVLSQSSWLNRVYTATDSPTMTWTNEGECIFSSPSNPDGRGLSLLCDEAGGITYATRIMFRSDPGEDPCGPYVVYTGVVNTEDLWTDPLTTLNNCVPIPRWQFPISGFPTNQINGGPTFDDFQTTTAHFEYGQARATFTAPATEVDDVIGGHSTQMGQFDT